MTPDAAAMLVPHIEHARWFGGKGRSFKVDAIRRVAQVPGDALPHVAVELAHLTYDNGDQEIYQLPLAYYPESQDRLEHAFIGYWEDPDFGPSHVYDAPSDREAMRKVLGAFDAAANESAEGSHVLRFHRLPGHDLDLEARAAVFTGEQSNTSVLFGEDALLKVFRRLTPGVNPDIAIHDVLTRAGSDHVAALYGWLDCVDEASGSVIQLAMLQQFLRTATDGWELAQSSVRNLFAEADLHADEVGGDFAAESTRLGIALAETHQVLAQEFPTEIRTREQMTQLSADMNRRLDEAIEIVAALAPHAPALRDLYADIAAMESVGIQRIHGDLHLGQALRTVRGWKLVDFEGEPLKSLADRSLPDSVWRDVAGVLRSFDYAPQVAARTADYGADNASAQRSYRATEWASRNCDAFLTAYTGRPLTDAEQALLAAYVADKAVYETVYEARNRPGWVSIPLAALARIAPPLDADTPGGAS